LVFSDHTQEFKGQNHEKTLERLRQKSLVALKQAKKPWLTNIHDPIPLHDWRKQNAEANLILVHPGEDKLPLAKNENIYLLIGPEGGFSAAELERF